MRKILRKKSKVELNNVKYYKLESNMVEFLNKMNQPYNILTIDKNLYIRQNEFENKYKKHADILRDFIDKHEEEFIKRYNEILFEEDASHYLDGGIGKWEMDSISYYATENELKYIDYEKYPFVERFDNLEIKPVSMLWKNKYPVYHLSNIIGTCLSRNKTKHMAKILTRSGVVTVKFKGSVFAYYDKQVKKNNSIIDSSFFSRGNKVILTGYRSNDDTFRVKTYSRTKMKPVYLVEKVKQDGELSMRSEKYN